MKQQLQLFWQQREPRERLILVVGAVLLGLILLYALLWQPVLNERQRLLRVVPRLEQDLAALKQIVSDVKGAAQPPRNELPVQAAVDGALRANGIDKAQLVGDGKRVTVTLDNASFAALTQALNSLQAEQGIQATSASVVSLPDAGMVKAQIELARP